LATSWLIVGIEIHILIGPSAEAKRRYEALPMLRAAHISKTAPKGRMSIQLRSGLRLDGSVHHQPP
jgi:hypothetical protein